MGRFDVYPNPGRDRTGYVLDVPADLLRDLGTRIVVPLLSSDVSPEAARGLNPAFAIEGRNHLMLTGFSPPCLQAVSDSRYYPSIQAAMTSRARSTSS